MANSKVSGAFHEYAVVNTAPAPDSGGYYTNVISPRKSKIRKLYFSIRETVDDSSVSVIVVALQFRCIKDSRWTDYVPLDGSSFAIGNRVVLEDMGEGIQWRAGVVDDSDFTSGSLTFGFDW